MPRFRALRADLEVDVAVVGAGISGACIARALAKPGRSVAILDRRIPMMGSTVASTALLVYEIDRPLFSLARRIGLDAARRAWRRSFAAVGALRRLVDTDGIRCQWQDRDALLLAGESFGSRALRSETAARRDADLSARFVAPEELRGDFGIERTGAIVSSGSAVGNPVQLSAGLLRAAMHRGAQIYSPVDVDTVSTDGGQVRLTTKSGFTVVAQDVVFCTGYEVLSCIPTKGHIVRSTWAFATATGAHYPRWLDGTVVWEASDPYLYLRTAPGRRLIVGGEDEGLGGRHNDRRLFDRKMRTLSAKVRELLPGSKFRVQHCWAGSFGDSESGLPRIDKVPGLPHCHIVMGFGGNGIANSMIASQIVAAAINGRVDPDADLYRLPRSHGRTA